MSATTPRIHVRTCIGSIESRVLEIISDRLSNYLVSIYVVKRICIIVVSANEMRSL